MLRNTVNRYGLVAIVLHWVIALLFIGQLVLGLWMVRLADQRLEFELIQWHKSFGFLILALVVLRIVWWGVNRHPILPETMPCFEKILARIVHVLLYGLMILMPITGWLLVSVSLLRVPTFAFDLLVIPHLPVHPSEQTESLWGSIHQLLGYLAVLLVAGHIAAAFFHQLWLRDGLMSRMMSSKERPPTKERQ